MNTVSKFDVVKEKFSSPQTGKVTLFDTHNFTFNKSKFDFETDKVGTGEDIDIYVFKKWLIIAVPDETSPGNFFNFNFLIKKEFKDKKEAESFSHSQTWPGDAYIEGDEVKIVISENGEYFQRLFEEDKHLELRFSVYKI